MFKKITEDKSPWDANGNEYPGHLPVPDAISSLEKQKLLRLGKSRPYEPGVSHDKRE